MQRLFLLYTPPQHLRCIWWFWCNNVHVYDCNCQMLEMCSAAPEKPLSPHLLCSKGNSQLCYSSCFTKGGREKCTSELQYNTWSKAWSPAPAQGLVVYSIYDILISVQTTQILLQPKPFLKAEFGSQSHSQTFRTFICPDCWYFLGTLVQKCAQLQFLYFCPAIFVPFLHHIKQFLVTATWTLSPATCTSFILLLSLKIHNRCSKSSTQNHSYTFTGTVNTNSQQSLPMSIGCSSQAFQNLQLLWGLLTLNKN